MAGLRRPALDKGGNAYEAHRYVVVGGHYAKACLKTIMSRSATMVGRYELHEWQWQLICDLFPPPKATGRKRRDPRQMLNAIFWILCSGASWRDLPERYGPWQSAYHWYRTWTNDGTFDRILERLQVRMRAEGLMDLDTWFVDSTHVRASRVAAGAKKGAVTL